MVNLRVRGKGCLKRLKKKQETRIKRNGQSKEKQTIDNHGKYY